MDQVVGSSDEKDDEPIYNGSEEVNEPITPQGEGIPREIVATTKHKSPKVTKRAQQKTRKKNCNKNKDWWKSSCQI